MWHPFDLFPDDLAVPAGLRELSLPGRVRLTYGERVVRWFKPKAGETYKQPVLDHGPGVNLEREPPENGRRVVRSRYERTHASPHVMEATMICGTDGWRSPLTWTIRQTFVGAAASGLLPALEEEGAWRDGQVHRRTRAGDGVMRAKMAATRLLNPYAWLVDFPRDLAKTAWSADAVVMEDGTLFTRGAALEPAGSATQGHKLAAGLEGWTLHHSGGLPMEFWVNAHGTVIFLCAGPTRVLVLDRAEALA